MHEISLCVFFLFFFLSVSSTCVQVATVDISVYFLLGALDVISFHLCRHNLDVLDR